VLLITVNIQIVLLITVNIQIVLLITVNIQIFPSNLTYSNWFLIFLFFRPNYPTERKDVLYTTYLSDARYFRSQFPSSFVSGFYLSPNITIITNYIRQNKSGQKFLTARQTKIAENSRCDMDRNVSVWTQGRWSVYVKSKQASTFAPWIEGTKYYLLS